MHGVGRCRPPKDPGKQKPTRGARTIVWQVLTLLLIPQPTMSGTTHRSTGNAGQTAQALATCVRMHAAGEGAPARSVISVASSVISVASGSESSHKDSMQRTVTSHSGALHPDGICGALTTPVTCGCAPWCVVSVASYVVSVASHGAVQRGSSLSCGARWCTGGCGVEAGGTADEGMAPRATVRGAGRTVNRVVSVASHVVSVASSGVRQRDAAGRHLP